MEELNLTPDQQKIAERILQFFEPATIEDYDMIIDIDDFINIFANIERPLLADIEEVLEILGFKEDDSRLELKFIIKIKKD